MFSWPKGFPRPQYIVIDESHRIEGDVTKAMALETSEDGVDSFVHNLQHKSGLGSLFYLLAQKETVKGESTSVINSIKKEIKKTAELLEEHTQNLNPLFERYFKKKSQRYSEKYWNELPMISLEKETDDLGRYLYNHLDSIRNILKMFFNFISPYMESISLESSNDKEYILAKSLFEGFLGNFDDLLKGLDSSLDKKEDYSHSMKFHEKEGYLLYSAPINIGKTIHENLLENTDSVVFTSATLGSEKSVQGMRGLEWLTGYTYIDPSRRFKKGFFLPSVFDYKNKTKVFLCDDVPALYEQNFVPDILERITSLVRELEGRCLFLFSAKIRFEIAREVFLKKFEGEIPLFFQGMGSHVVEDFKKSKNGILVGMESFGEGIDIPGETLQFIFIDKIPDLKKDLVIQERMNYYDTNIGNSFEDYYLSYRSRSLHQKLGRLLRKDDDYGGVIIVDSRIKSWKNRTVQKFFKQMEPYQIERGDLDSACKETLNFIFDKRKRESKTYLDS